MARNPLEEIYKKRVQKEKEHKKSITIPSDLLKVISFAIMGIIISIVLYSTFFNDPFREEDTQTESNTKAQPKSIPLLVAGLSKIFIKENGSISFFRVILTFLGGYGLFKICNHFKYLIQKKQR